MGPNPFLCLPLPVTVERFCATGCLQVLSPACLTWRPVLATILRHIAEHFTVLGAVLCLLCFDTGRPCRTISQVWDHP